MGCQQAESDQQSLACLCWTHYIAFMDTSAGLLTSDSTLVIGSDFGAQCDSLALSLLNIVVHMIGDRVLLNAEISFNKEGLM